MKQISSLKSFMPPFILSPFQLNKTTKKSRIKFLLYIINFSSVCLPMFKLLKGWKDERLKEWLSPRVHFRSPSQIHATAFMFHKTAFEDDFPWKNIPKYLTTHFWGGIFALVSSPRSTQSFLSPLLSSFATLGFTLDDVKRKTLWDSWDSVVKRTHNS